MERLKKTVSLLERIQASKQNMLGVEMALKSNVFWEKIKKLVKVMKSGMMSVMVVEFPLMLLSRVIS